MSELEIIPILRQNLASVHERMATAARTAGRSPAEILLVGVSKYVNGELTAALVAAGCADLGESRPQSLWEKTEALGLPNVRWHLIGHLQRNKVRRTLPLVHLFHGGDSLRLLQEINHEAELLGRPCAALLEVNISQDANKHGFTPEQLRATLPEIAAMRHLYIRGLMGMASLQGGVEQARRDFAALRILRDDLQRNCPPEISLAELSMGMSGDFEAAILEGATIVRVGSALWENVPGVDA